MNLRFYNTVNRVSSHGQALLDCTVSVVNSAFFNSAVQQLVMTHQYYKGGGGSTVLINCFNDFMFVKQFHERWFSFDCI